MTAESRTFSHGRHLRTPLREAIRRTQRISNLRRRDMLEPGNTVMWVIVGLAIVGVMLAFAMFARLFRKAGPHEALVVYGFRGTRIVIGRGTVILPMIEMYRLLSLELVSFDVAAPPDACT